MIRGVWQYAFQNISISVSSSPFLASSFYRRKGHTHCPLSSFLSPRFHLQGRQALLWHKLKKVRRDNERKLSFISPWFLVVVSTAAEARQNALGRRKRERERLYVRVRGSIVYCLLCNSQRMALISRADCDTEPWWGTEGIMLFHNYLSPSLSLLL